MAAQPIGPNKKGLQGVTRKAYSPRLWLMLPTNQSIKKIDSCTNKFVNF
jgi:hypothetical protein